MPAKRELTMRQIRELLRLAHDGCSVRDMARRFGVARSTIQDNLKRAREASLAWPLPDDLTNDFLEQSLFARTGTKVGFRRRPEPDWALLAREMKRPGVNLSVLWEEYRQVHPEGYGYSRFCELFRDFEQRLSPVMRQDHVAGDKGFVDYSGKKVPITDPKTGEMREAEIFVGVLGASSYTYAEASWSQSLPDWIGAHVRMFEFYGGVPRLIVPDNLKSGVNKASFYDPEINRSYGMMAAHYGVGILPARPRKPRDKAKVESGVRLAQTYILGRLRHQPFFSLADCNAAIRSVLLDLNGRVMRRLGVGRKELFETIERPALRPLPAEAYEFAVWQFARVGPDYHVEDPVCSRIAAKIRHDEPDLRSFAPAGGKIEKFFYSVPYGLIRNQVDVRITRRVVEIFHKGRRVASHQRRYGGRRHGTNPESQSLDHHEWLGLLLSYEATSRQQKRFDRRLKTAKLRQAASVEDVDYRASRGLDRGLFQKLATNDWIRDRRNLLITGPCGIGKSYLACALGHKACRDDLSVVYHRAPRLFAALALARGDGRYARMLRSIAKIKLLIIDDWGPEPLNADQRRDLLEIVEDRYDIGSILITSQLPLENWHEIIGDPTIADAILDRVVHNAYRIELSGESLRKTRRQDDQA